MDIKNYKNRIMLPHEEAAVQQASKGVVRRILAYSDDAMCVENTFETGAVGSLHSHPHTQVTYIVSGRYRFTVGDETYEVKALEGIIDAGVEVEVVLVEDKKIYVKPVSEDF